MTTSVSKDLFNIKEASLWASKYLKRDISESNISYLIQYGKVRKIKSVNGTLVSKSDLEKYYNSYQWKRQADWKKKLGKDLNWTLSFDHLREKDTTKHVHRLHPYKGKFIPQLVEYFIDNHTDEFKKETFFNKGDIILDPFCGSGTTLVQANESGMHAIGIDVSAYNAFISNAKISGYDFQDISHHIRTISHALDTRSMKSKVPVFEEKLLQELYHFNSEHFPSPEFRYKVSQKKVNEKEYAPQKEKEFLPVYNSLIKEYGINIVNKKQDTFLNKWFIQSIREETEYVFELIKKVEKPRTRMLLGIILSRVIRSCRATTHSDLATLKEPQVTSYYCVKHKKICKPLFSIGTKWKTYSNDTLQRLKTLDEIRTKNTYQKCLTGDSRTLNIFTELQKKHPKFARLAKEIKISGIFSSPPYVGLINYHEQHAYAYELFGFDRQDELEIGPLFKGQGKAARGSYADGIADVLNNCKKYLVDDYNVFLVANDKFNLYPRIADKAGMIIVNQYKRPVLNRTERDKGAYSEIIFHLREKDK